MPIVFADHRPPCKRAAAQLRHGAASAYVRPDGNPMIAGRDEYRHGCMLAASRCSALARRLRRRSQLRRCRASAQTTSRVSRRIARSTISSSRVSRAASGRRGRARAHPVRFLRQHPAKAMRCNSARSPRSNTGEGKVALSDLRATTWEDGEAKTSASTRRISQPEARSTGRRAAPSARRRHRGQADQARGQDVRPDRRRWCFPTEHMRRIIAAARAGQDDARVAGL